MKILLLAAPVHYSGDHLAMRSMPPPSIYLLASVLTDAGYGVDILDPYVIRNTYKNEEDIEKLRQLIKEKLHGVDVVGISSNTTNWGMAKLIIKEIHDAYPDIPIIVGGVHAFYFDKHIIESTAASFVIRGEGEDALIELMDALQGKRPLNSILGLTWKDEKGNWIRNADRPWNCTFDIDKTPLPAYDRLPDDIYIVMPVETSRGCKYSCRFCSVPRRSNWQGAESDLVVQRVLELEKRYMHKFAEKAMYFVDDCFTADSERALAVLNGLKKSNFKSDLIIEARATDLIKDDLLELIPKDMIARLAIGVECGYDEGLRKIGKGLTISQLTQCLDKLEALDLTKYAYLSFIIGFPWESEEECLRTVHMAAYLVREYGVKANLNWLILYPSTIWTEREKYNIDLNEGIFDDPTYLWNSSYFYQTHPTISPEAQKRIDAVIATYLTNGCDIKAK